jgi:hypothetical protein
MPSIHGVRNRRADLGLIAQSCGGVSHIDGLLRWLDQHKHTTTNNAAVKEEEEEEEEEDDPTQPSGRQSSSPSWSLLV